LLLLNCSVLFSHEILKTASILLKMARGKIAIELLAVNMLRFVRVPNLCTECYHFVAMFVGR
jgi:hypothetical protein